MTRERPILFSSPMIKAILAGTKTVTRRIVKHQPQQGCVEDAPQLGNGWIWWPRGKKHERYNNPCGERELVETMSASPFAYADRGECLWVRETFALAPLCEEPIDEDDWAPVYRADGDERPWKSSLEEDAVDIRPPWRPSIFMPRWASRITLEVVDVRVERLHAITEEDAKREGVEPYEFSRRVYPSKLAAEVTTLSYREGFHSLWDAINGKRAPWSSNPWVWRVGFKRERP